ncbi:hypothetical protein ACFQ9U_31210 [Streptomyces sp. NPDC056568]|uniref:hypothetical protein n=1 Tax=Streptomyces sp. NPDC056568 TaxID=3345866 RepID=UPI0036905B6B
MASWKRDEGSPGRRGRRDDGGLGPAEKESAVRARVPGGGEPGPGRGHVSAAGLRARGWTAEMVRRLLGEPDLLRSHPYLRSAPPTHLYAVDRVEAVERGAAFRAAAAAATRRSTAGRVAGRLRMREVRARLSARQRGEWAGNLSAEADGRADDREADRPPPKESM